MLHRLISIIICAFLSSLTRGSEYHVKSDPSSSYRCTDTNTTCHIYCDASEHANINTYRCGDAIHCHFHCDETKCGASATIYGDNAANLTVTQNINGKECFQDAIIYTPNYGNAYFSTSSLQGFKAMTVKSGSNSKEIVINCNSPQQQQDDCREMNVDAAAAEYLRINIGNQLQFSSATVQCPVNSTRESPPCVIDATDGIMTDILIIAPDGTPKGVYVEHCSFCDASVRIQCHNINTEAPFSTYPFSTNSECWSTNAPTAKSTQNPALSTTTANDQISVVTAQWQHSYSSTLSSCNTECSEDPLHWIQIKVRFSFAEHIMYDLTDIECFLYPIFVKWLEIYGVIPSFEPCDIHVISIIGGYETQQFCVQPPCIQSITNKANRRMLQIDGNTTMTVITKNQEIVKYLKAISVESGQHKFETQYLHHFALAIIVHLEVKQQNETQDSLFDWQLIIFSVLITLAAVICCIVCFVMYYVIRNSRDTTQKDTKEAKEPELNKKVTTSNLTNIDYRAGASELNNITEIIQPRSVRMSVEFLEVNQIHHNLDPHSNVCRGLRTPTESRTESKYPDIPSTYNTHTQLQHNRMQPPKVNGLYNYVFRQRNRQKGGKQSVYDSREDISLVSNQGLPSSRRQEESGSMTVSSWKTIHDSTNSSSKPTNKNRKATDSAPILQKMMISATPIGAGAVIQEMDEDIFSVTDVSDLYGNCSNNE